jgi:hypothetical protein
VQHRTAISLGLAVAMAVALILLASAPPEQNPYAPPCVFHKLTGLHCPGCGATRCVYALLHGDILTAAGKNILAFLAIPWLVWKLGGMWWRWWRQIPPPLPPEPANLPLKRKRWHGPKVVAITVILFFILRNLPWEPFRWLAPQ